MPAVCNVGMEMGARVSPDYLMSERGRISRWLLLTQRMHDAKEATGPRVAIEKNRVMSFGDGFVEIRPEYFHPSQNTIGPIRMLVTEMADEIQVLLDS